jgi:hypothetical protein
MEINKDCDGHTVFIKCSKSLTNHEIIDLFRQILDKYIDDTGDKIQCDFYVNIISNKDDYSSGIGFVYLTNSEFYYILFGKNKDGSERFEYIDDPDWVDPPRSRSGSSSSSLKISEEKKKSLDNSNSLFNLDWTAIMEADEDYERQEKIIKNKHVCPKIKIALEPLIVVDIDDFYLEPCQPAKVEGTNHHHILKSTNLPSHIDINDLNDKFRPLVSDQNATYKRKVKGKITEHLYPYIIITKDRTAYIIFDENSNDARFAIHQSRKTFVKETKLWFVFSQKRDNIDDLDSLSNSNGHKNNKNSYNNNSPNRSPYNNNSPNRSPYNNNSPKNHSPNKNRDDDIVDTDGFRYVKYNRK